MLTASELVKFCEFMLGRPYWYGTCGYECTESLLQRKAKQYPAHYGSSRMSKYRKAIKEKQVCCDCIGLVKAYFWTNGGQSIRDYIAGNGHVNTKYQSNGLPDKSANGTLSWCKKQGCQWGTMSNLPDTPGILLFKEGHVGVYVGGGYAIEAMGFNYGVRKTKVEGRGWRNWAYLPDSIISYDTHGGQTAPVEDVKQPEVQPTKPEYVLGSRILKNGMKGDDVKALQEALNALGYACGTADGEFGRNTKKGVKAFQKAMGLGVDGEYGPKSHAALLKAQQTQKKQVRVEGGKVNVRSMPDVQVGKVKYVVKKGDVLEVTGTDEKTGWYRLADGNYISYKYVKEI